MSPYYRLITINLDSKFGSSLCVTASCLSVINNAEIAICHHYGIHTFRKTFKLPMFPDASES